MLAKKNRVKRKEFETLLKEGVLSHTPYFSLRYKQIGKEEPFGFAVVISKKTIKTSVGRNLWKRRVRAVIQELLSEKKGIWPIEAVLFLKKEGAELSFQDLKLEIKAIFRKIRL